MIFVVFDTNVIVSAIYWPRSTARRCLAGLARRQFGVAVTREVFDEYESLTVEFQPRFPDCNSDGALGWLRLKARWVDPVPLGKQRSRDPNDDPFLSCAVSVRARFLVTRDGDLLALQKPFGVETITPAQLVRWLRQSKRPT